MTAVAEADGAVRLVLASSSPRRLALLERIGVVPGRIVAPAIDETPVGDERPRDHALRLAVAKALAVERAADEVVLAGDTVVAAGRRILGKADSEAAVAQMLALLSGRRHRVFSAVAVIDAQGRTRSRLSETIVAFKRLTDREIADYAAGGEGLGKAGGYAVQGCAEAFVRFLAGSHSGVVGLPLFETRSLLTAAGVPLG